MAGDLDFASWDSYPLGFLASFPLFSEAHRKHFLRSGDPDYVALHHDLYRACGQGRWWVMEQQPGPVNWAPYNPAPLPGMARFWALEAFAHCAEVVSCFRWRQAPFGQERKTGHEIMGDRPPRRKLTQNVDLKPLKLSNHVGAEAHEIQAVRRIWVRGVRFGNSISSKSRYSMLQNTLAQAWFKAATSS